MIPHPSRRDGAHIPFDDGQLGPDSDEWPGEQSRRLDDSYRSWRGDRYRRVPDRSSRSHESGQTHPPGDGAPKMGPSRG